VDVGIIAVQEKWKWNVLKVDAADAENPAAVVWSSVSERPLSG
jgi:hypothetical protein